MSTNAFTFLKSAALLTMAAGTAHAQVTVAPVALSGTGQSGALGPGIGANTFSANAFSAAGRPSVLNANGDVVFVGAFAGGSGVWRNIAGSNANANLARTTQALPAPATGGTFTTQTWASTFVDNGGNAAFYHALVATPGPLGGTFDSGVFRVSASGAANFATRGTNASSSPLAGIGAGRPLPTAHGANPPTQLQLSTNQAMMSFNNAGAGLLVAAWNDGAGNSGNGLYAASPQAGNYDALTPIVLRGDTVPAFDNVTGAQIDFVNSSLAFNNNGRVAFGVDFISGTTPTSGQNRGLVTNRNGSLETLFVRSTAAPFLPAGVTVGTIGSIATSMNDAGQISTTIPLAGTGISQANDSMLTRFNTDGSVNTLSEGANSGRTTGGGSTIRLGGAASGVSGFGTASINQRGVVFAIANGNTDNTGTALPAGSGNSALVRWSPESGTQTIALTGDTAPGTGGGVFATFNASARAINDNNMVAFLATLSVGVGGVTTSNDLCLFATDPTGQLYLIAREGFGLTGDPVGGRTVSSILFNSVLNNQPSNGMDGRGIVLNNSGQLVFNVGFSDGNSGVFIADVVPTPAGAGLLALAGLAAARRRRA